MATASRLFVFLRLALAFGCAPPTGAPATADASSPLPRSQPADASLPSTPRPLPAKTMVHVHLPGPDATRHLNVSVDIGRGADWFIEGCVAAARGVCFWARQVVMRPEDRVAYVQHWATVYAMPRCAPTDAPRASRLLDLDGPAGHMEDFLPEDVTQIAATTQGPCRAPARLAVWVAQRFGAL